MQNRAKELYRKTFEFYVSIYQELQNYREDAKRLNDIKAQADLAYVIRESEKLLDDLRKELGKLERQSHMITSVLYLKSADSLEIATSLNASLRIETDYCTAKPKIKKVPVLPKLKTERDAYLALMQHIGVSAEMAERDICRPHWNGMKEYVNQLLKEGRPTPPGIDPEKMFTEYTLSIVKKKGILE